MARGRSRTPSASFDRRFRARAPRPILQPRRHLRIRRASMTRTALWLALAAMLLAVSSRSEAQNFRSYVSSTGGGTACTVAAPCGTLQAAHDHTIPGGEVRCLDAGPTNALIALA